MDITARMFADQYVQRTSKLDNRNILALASVVDATRRVTDLHEPSGPQNIEQPVVRKGTRLGEDAIS